MGKELLIFCIVMIVILGWVALTASGPYITIHRLMAIIVLIVFIGIMVIDD